ncbi:hypothetical protein OG455_14830 [Kitasatospora sp. NBC_01287]|uniref:hypothetical protein n=1 Tax=Kitasatospora sp. NBC_01287 TaxID=2903573 RepID=UPI00224CFB98|nr:hypothetical protein [Kitasatospora sp. NBC_01287]MCX4746780.1 hypothetical protein [Kitasatospora sp. NBC_01287]
MRFVLPSRAAVLTAAALLAVASAAPASAAPATVLPPANPYAGPPGSATMHGDTGSSDATVLAGPPAGPLTSHRTALASACPTILDGSDGIPVALCTTMFGQIPTVHLLDPATGDSTAQLALTKGSLLGGVYAYLDDQNRLVVVDGNRDLLRIGHHNGTLTVESTLSLAAAVPAGDSVVGLSPDWQGRVWFATTNGLVGTADPVTGAVHTLALPAGEQVANSISTVPGGTAVATTAALYLLTAGPDGTPRISWRQAYDRGPARKPGQLSWGTGSTPVFFGPATGTEYVAITDNAVPHEHLLVYRADTGAQVCAVPVLLAAGSESGTENAPIGAGGSVFVAGTYGYPYPALPAGAPASVPASADFEGGMSRVDVRADGSGCDLVWDTTTRSAAVPQLTLGDQLIHTVLREPVIPGTSGTSILDPYYYAEIDPRTGAVVRTSLLGVTSLYDSLQMVGTTAPGGVVYQGSLTGVLRISAG